MQEEEEGETPEEKDVPTNPKKAAGEALEANHPGKTGAAPEKRSLSKIAKGAIFREVVLAKVREMKEAEKQKEFEKTAAESSKAAY